MAALLIVVGILLGLLGGWHFWQSMLATSRDMATGAAAFGFALFVPGLLMFIYGVKGAGPGPESRGNTKRCPFCAEMIKPDANVCRYCGRDLQA